jgi:uncharacterized Zn-finger protein
MENEQFVCGLDGCAKVFQSKPALTQHKLIHSDERKYFCLWPNCGKSFKQQSGLINHRRIHGSKNIMCDSIGCGKRFTHWALLRSHKYRVHLKSELPDLNCYWPNCLYKTKYTQDLKKHQMVHSPERRFKCKFDGCDRSYKTSSSLCYHKRVDHEYENVLLMEL